MLQTDEGEADLGMLEGHDSTTHRHLVDKLRALKVVNPYAVGTLEKVGDDAYRVRQGDWRALVVSKDSERSLLIIAVVRRNEATY